MSKTTPPRTTALGVCASLTATHAYPLVPYEFRVAADEAGVPEARRKVMRIVRDWAVPLTGESLDDLALLSSEVITNAIRHTNAPCTVTVRWTGRRLLVEVTDTDPARPAPRDRHTSAEGGRGLLLVNELSADWGSSLVPGGKVVWFEIRSAEENKQPEAEPGLMPAKPGTGRLRRLIHLRPRIQLPGRTSADRRPSLDMTVCRGTAR